MPFGDSFATKASECRRVCAGSPLSSAAASSCSRPTTSFAFAGWMDWGGSSKQLGQRGEGHKKEAAAGWGKGKGKGIGGGGGGGDLFRSGSKLQGN